MEYWTSYITDIGTSRKTNQDALLLKSAKTPYGKVLLAAIADGVGGLKQGELASNTMTHDLAGWFEKELPLLIKTGDCLERAKESLLRVIRNTHQKLYDYMQKNNTQLGTTIALLFLSGNQYLVIHVGDTRVYRCSKGEVRQLTRDHTYVQREMDAGRMTRQQAEGSRHKNVLTQCIGTTRDMMPDVYAGTLDGQSLFLICSDGFRNLISDEELGGRLTQALDCRRDEFNQMPEEITDLLKGRGEKDNISALLVKCMQER